MSKIKRCMFESLLFDPITNIKVVLGFLLYLQRPKVLARLRTEKYNNQLQKAYTMSFQAYIDNIQKKTGKTPDDFKRLAEEKGFLKDGELVPTVKATQVTDWLKAEFELGHGHAMAIYATFKGKTE